VILHRLKRSVNREGQFEHGRWQRCMALGCILLVLLFAGLEATHMHPDARLARSSEPCAVCISVHANAPAVTFHPLPTLLAVESLAVPFRVEHKGISKELRLFIRPPPYS
jgi:hypothetical protein